MDATIGENLPQITDEPIEYEKYLLEVQNLKKIANHFRRIYETYPKLPKKNQKMSTCNTLGLETLES
jgi:hypothetical protein